jgi:hypothetical protein
MRASASGAAARNAAQIRALPPKRYLLDARMEQLNDGTTYASAITLIAKAKDLQVAVQNGGYRNMT